MTECLYGPPKPLVICRHGIHMMLPLVERASLVSPSLSPRPVLGASIDWWRCADCGLRARYKARVTRLRVVLPKDYLAHTAILPAAELGDAP